jgi:hypothetical protein
MKWLVFILPLLVGCLHLQPQGPALMRSFRGPVVGTSQADCAVLDRDVLGLTVGSVIAGGLSTGAGIFEPLSTAVAWKYSFVAVGIVTGIGGAAMSALTTIFAKRYTDQCTINVGGK